MLSDRERERERERERGGVVDGCGGLCIKQRVNRAAFNLLNKDS